MIVDLFSPRMHPSTFTFFPVDISLLNYAGSSWTHPVHNNAINRTGIYYSSRIAGVPIFP